MNHINVQDKSPSEARLQKMRFNPTSLTLIKTVGGGNHHPREKKSLFLFALNIQ